MGCTRREKSIKLNLSTPSCIFMENVMYWEAGVVDKIDVLEPIGKIEDVSEENCLPDKNRMISYSAKKYIHKSLYKKGNSLYIKDSSDIYHEFTYLNSMQLEKEKPYEKEIDCPTEEIKAPDANKPHFIFNGMSYSSMMEIPMVEDLRLFQEAGTIKKRVKIAQYDFTGNLEVGDVLYTSEYQNRYMIVKYKTKGTYQYYENDAYKEK